MVAYSSLGGAGSQERLADSNLRKLARREGVTAAQLLLLWSLSQGIAVIPSARSEAHMLENLNCSGRGPLRQDVMTALSSLPAAEQQRSIMPESG